MAHLVARAQRFPTFEQLGASPWAERARTELRVSGEMPSSLFAFLAILFTSGLDVGLIMFPLTEFPVYAAEAPYQFANPLAIEFGFWGFLVWMFYFLTTFYFCAIEPRLKLFQIPLIKFLNNLVVIATCAFTGFLFLSYLPNYILGISEPLRFGLVGLEAVQGGFGPLLRFRADQAGGVQDAAETFD